MKKITLFAIFLSGVLLRFLVLSIRQNQTGGVLAATALVTKHILLKKTFPLSYPMVHYGEILRCYIGALMFKIFGVSIFAANLTIILFYSLPTVIVVYFLSKKISRNQNVAILSTLFMSLAPMFVNLYILHQLATLLVPIILLLAYLISFEGPTLKPFRKSSFYSILGLATGVGIWNDPLILPYVMAGALFLFIKDRDAVFKRNFSLFLAFSFIGCLPYIVYNIINPFVSVMRLGSYILDVDRSVLQQDGPVFILLRKVLEKIIYIPKAMLGTLGALRSGFGTDEKALGGLAPLGLPAIAIYIASILYAIYNRRKIFLDLFRFRLKINELNGVDMLLFALIFAYISSSIVGFYGWWRMTPFYPILVIFISIFLLRLWQRFKILSTTLIVLILVVNLTTNVIALKQPIPPYKTLINFLETRDLRAGYSDYNVSYMVTFMSDEEIIILPTASMEDVGFVEYGLKWPEYGRAVESAENVCYIFDLQIHESEIQIMQQKLRGLNITYKAKLIYPFYIYYNFSRKPIPEELNLPELRYVSE